RTFTDGFMIEGWLKRDGSDLGWRQKQHRGVARGSTFGRRRNQHLDPEGAARRVDDRVDVHDLADDQGLLLGRLQDPYTDGVVILEGGKILTVAIHDHFEASDVDYSRDRFEALHRLTDGLVGLQHNPVDRRYHRAAAEPRLP